MSLNHVSMSNVLSALWTAVLLCSKMARAQSLSSQVLSSLEFQFREEQNPGTYVGNVGIASKLATSLTDADFSRLKFDLPDSKYFDIDEKSASLTSARRIDREEVCDSQPVCKLTAEIIVYTRLNTGNYDILKVIAVNVEIQDINDNPPKFPAEVVSLSIPESNNPNEELPTSGAVDKDTGENSVQQYSFKDPTDTFTLSVHNNPDGSTYLGIIVKVKLDREVRDFYQLTVVATDGGVPQKSGSALINITVFDVNDNSPEFQQPSYNESVPENVALRMPIMKVQATDKDAGKNAEISYQFSSRVSSKIREKFMVDERTGEISAQSSLDYEEDKLFQFIIEAVDHGTPQHSSRTNVNLHVIDMNDNSPQININLPPMGTEVSENEPVGKFIAQVLALDADSGSNGAVTCSLDDEHFSLEKFNDNASNMYKIVLAKPLNYEESTSLRVTVTCKDSGMPSLSNSTTFVVNILDVNDVRPAFTQTTYDASVIENLDGGEDILQVTARDWDSGEFGRVTYSLEDKYDGLFIINPTNGKLKVLHTLDREAVPRYDFHVIARDNGPERLSSSALVVVNVDDENDEPPRFTKPVYFGNILENQPTGTLVGNASAEDPDSPANSKKVYSILQQGADYKNFSIDPASGAIKSTAVFDREDIDRYHFMVRVVDPTKPQFFSTCNFTVRVLDDNDHSPVIHLPVEDNSTMIVQYSTPVGYILATVSADDEDEAATQHSDLIYLIQDGDPYQLFDLNRFTGSLSLARLISTKDIRAYSLLILVQDGGDPPRSDTKHLNIRVNGTIPPVIEGGLSQNIIIVLILIGVTAILALVILATILLIRKIDQKRRKNKSSKKNAEEKMYQLKQQDIFTNISVSIADDSSSNNLSKRGKKEVSFSLDEEIDAHNTSNGSSQPLTSFKGGMEPTDLIDFSKRSYSPKERGSPERNYSPKERGITGAELQSQGEGNHRSGVTVPRRGESPERSYSPKERGITGAELQSQGEGNHRSGVTVPRRGESPERTYSPKERRITRVELQSQGEANHQSGVTVPRRGESPERSYSPRERGIIDALIFGQNKLSGPSNTKLSNGLMNIPVQADKTGNFRRSHRDEKNQPTDIMRKTTEDAVSQSSEETDPSDSGRGGSEDDSSHRGSGIDPEHSSNKFCPHAYLRGAHTDAKNRHQMYHQQRFSLHPPETSRHMPPPSGRETRFRQSVPSQRSPHSSVTSDFESDYSADPSSQSRSDTERSTPVTHYLQTLGTVGRATNQVIPLRPQDSNLSRSLTQDWPNRVTPSHNNNNNNSALMRSFHGQPSNRLTIAPPSASLSSVRLAHPSPDRSFGPPSDRSYKYSDRSYPSSLRTNTQSSLTEDDHTTTSGSYSLNPEDIRRDMDSMVRDSVV